MLPQIWPAILTLGWILFAIAAGEGAMALVALASHDGLAGVFVANAAITALFAGACVLTTKGRTFQLRFRDAALLTVVSWFVVPLFGALPLTAPPAGLSLLDAYFESVSGLTTTGSTVLSGLDKLPPSILLWRSTLQWIGGIGIIGLAILILPFLKIGGMQLFRLESSDRSEDVVPRVRSVANSVGQIYLAITLACFLAYWGARHDAVRRAQPCLHDRVHRRLLDPRCVVLVVQQPAHRMGGGRLHERRCASLPSLPAHPQARPAQPARRSAGQGLLSHRGGAVARFSPSG